MSFSRTHRFSFKIFEAGLLAKTIEAIAGDNPQSLEISDSENLPDGGSVLHKFTSTSDVSKICDIRTHWINVWIRTSSGKFWSFDLRADDGLITANVSADTTESRRAVLGLLMKGLELTEASTELQAKHRPPTQKEISDRLAALERIVLGPNRRLRCFLSYRFSPENKEPARRLEEFLGLLDIDVVTGNTYEPRAISRKIIDKLNDSIDFVILLIGTDGESLWTRDEVATAKNKMIPLIPVVEEGATFASGLFGDLEHITYGKGHIGDSFLKILEGIKYVRQKSFTANSD